MQAVPLSFFFVLSGLAVGGIIASIAAHLRTELARGYLLFNGTVLLLFMVMALWLRWSLPFTTLLPNTSPTLWFSYEPVMWLFFVSLIAVHLVMVRRERPHLAMAAGLAAGAMGLLTFAVCVALYLPPNVSFPLALFATGASVLVLGSVWSGWMLGHWYLVVPQLSPRPLLLINSLLGAALGLQVVLVTVQLGLSFGMTPSEFGPTALLDRYTWWLGLRVGIGLVFPLSLCWMIWRTARTRSMMAATGLLYVCTGAVISGEIIARVLYFTVRVPL